MQQVAAHASSIAWRWPVIARVLIYATALGVLMSFTGVFGLGDDPAVMRTVYLVAASWVGGAFAIAGYAAARQVAWARGRFWGRVLIADALIVLPSGILVWASTWLFGNGFGLSALPVFLMNGFIVWGAFIAAFVAPTMDAAARREAEAASADARPADFADRLPPRLRHAELWALKAEDHYLRAITSQGEALMRLRLADALRELHALEGAQTHRSWWVARGAVSGVKRGDGKVALALPNGQEVPVSRTYARKLRAARWF